MKRLSRSTLVWLALALAGLVVAVSVSYAVSQLSKPQIGLTSEPVSGVTELAPKATGPANLPRGPKQRRRPPTVTTHQQPTTSVPSDDEGGGHDD